MERLLLTYTTLLLILISVDNSEGQCSMFTYTMQPPIPLDCNPFSNDPTPVWKLRTFCSAVSTSTDLFEVHWFHRDTNGTINDLGQTSFTHNENLRRITSFFGQQYQDQSFSESLLGQYWCEVVIDGTQTGAYSDGLTIIRPEEYDTQLSTCSGLRQQPVDICRDSQPPPPPAASSSTSIPSSSPSSPSSTSSSTSSLSSSSSSLPPSPSPIIQSSSTTVPLAVYISVSSISEEIFVFTSSSVATTSLQLESSTVLLQTPPSSQILTTSTASIVQSTSSDPVTTSTLSPTSSTTTTMNDLSLTLASSKLDSVTSTSSYTSSTAIPNINQPSTIIPEERINNDNMEYLLLTAIILIVILTIMIILLSIIAYLMKCGRRPKQVTYRRNKRNFFRLSTVRSLRTGLLQYPEDVFQTTYISASKDMPILLQPVQHRYSTIDDSMIISTSVTNSNTSPTSRTNRDMSSTSRTNKDMSSNSRTVRETSFNVSNLPQVKPPAIIKSKSFSNRNQLSSSHVLPPLPSYTQNGSFNYQRIQETTTDNEHQHGESTGNTTIEINGYSILNKPANISTDENINSTNTTNELKKLVNTEGQLENWDYEWNPMYMKTSVGMRSVNTL